MTEPDEGRVFALESKNQGGFCATPQRYHTELLLELPVTKSGVNPLIIFIPLSEGGEVASVRPDMKALSSNKFKQLPAHWVIFNSHFQFLMPFSRELGFNTFCCASAL